MRIDSKRDVIVERLLVSPANFRNPSTKNAENQRLQEYRILCSQARRIRNQVSLICDSLATNIIVVRDRKSLHAYHHLVKMALSRKGCEKITEIGGRASLPAELHIFSDIVEQASLPIRVNLRTTIPSPSMNNSPSFRQSFWRGSAAVPAAGHPSRKTPLSRAQASDTKLSIA